MPMNNDLRPPCASGRYYRVKEGETLISIAAKVGVAREELEELNPEVNWLNLQIGQLLCLPGERPCPSGIYWEVEAGDTLYLIAREIGTTVEEIMKLNPEIQPENLQIGQLLCLP